MNTGLEGKIDRRSLLRGVGGIGIGLSVAAFATGCGNGAGAGKAGKLSMIGVSEPRAGRGLSKLLDDYRSQNGIEVDYQYFPSPQFVALFTTAQRAGNPPGIINLNGQDVRKYAVNGTLEPLELPYLDRFRPLGPKTFTVEDKLYGVPSGAQGGFMIVSNQKLLDKIGAEYPETYDDLKAVAAEFKKIGVAAYTHPGKTTYLWPAWFFTTYAQTTGNKSTEQTMALLQDGGMKWTDDEVVEALDLVFAFQRDGIFADDIFGLDASGALAIIARSKAAFYHGGDISAIINDNPPDVDPRLQLAQKFVSDPEILSQYPGGPGSPLCINAKAKDEDKEKGLALMDFLTTDASSAYISKDGGSFFSVNEKAVGSDNPIAKAAAQWVDRMVVFLDWYWPAEITAAFQQGIPEGLTGKKTAGQVAADIQKVWEGLLKSGYKFQ